VVAVADDASFDMDEMARYLKEQGLRVQAVPEQLELVDAVPRNPAGKILKHALRERYAPARSGGGA
jgi:non-ribosomal peptide synthetase component E (peptide arylation enzyme)